MVERRTRDRKVAGSIPGRGGGRIFFSRVIFVVAASSFQYPSLSRVNAVVRKRSRAFCCTAGGRSKLNNYAIQAAGEPCQLVGKAPDS